jgi:hypothetical protein
MMSTSSDESEESAEIVLHYTFEYDTEGTGIEGDRYQSFDFDAESDEDAERIALDALKEGEKPVNLWKTVSIRSWGDNESPPWHD